MLKVQYINCGGVHHKSKNSPNFSNQNKMDTKSLLMILSF